MKSGIVALLAFETSTSPKSEIPMIMTFDFAIPVWELLLLLGGLGVGFYITHWKLANKFGKMQEKVRRHEKNDKETQKGIKELTKAIMTLDKNLSSEIGYIKGCINIHPHFAPIRPPPAAPPSTAESEDQNPPISS